MVQRCFFSLMVVALLAGCAVQRDLTVKRAVDLKQRNSQFDLDIAWDVTAGGTQTHVDGVIRNVWSAGIEELELRVELQDSSARTVAHAVSYVARTLRTGETVPFSLILPARADSGSKLLFTYRYVPQGGDTDLWMHSFETAIP